MGSLVSCCEIRHKLASRLRHPFAQQPHQPHVEAVEASLGPNHLEDASLVLGQVARRLLHIDHTQRRHDAIYIYPQRVVKGSELFPAQRDLQPLVAARHLEQAPHTRDI